jgi:Ca-activated chloride channel homolog
MIGLLGFDLLRAELWPLFGLCLLSALLGMAALAARQKSRERLADRDLLPTLCVSFSSNRARLRIGLEASALGLAVFAILGPVRGYTEVPVVRKGLDIVICLDTSRSMLARDLSPDRLERARREVGDLLENLAGDRVALVAFSGVAREVAPLTRDRNALKGFLKRVSPEDNRVGGTSLGAALEYALTIFDGRTGAHEAIVVLTDGEDLSGEGLEVARRAKEQGIGVYVVGLGTEQGGKIPIVGPGGAEYFLRGPDGEEVVTKLDRESLGQLATVTGGAFLTTSDSPSPLAEIYSKRIGKLDRREMGGSDEKVPHDRFQWALVPGALCALLALGLRERRSARAIARQLAKGLRTAGIVLFPLFVLTLGEPILHAQDGPEPVEIAAPFDDPDPQAAVVLAHVIECAESDRLEEALLWLNFSLGIEPDDIEKVASSEVLTASAEVERHRFVWSDLEKAHLRYAKGIVLDRLGITSKATSEFLAAAALAGPGDLRARGLYNRGTIRLVETEAKRAGFIADAQSQGAGSPPLPPTPGVQEEEPEDPIEVLREGYGAARELLVENMKVDPNHVDTRANLELIVRRLRELDEMEKQEQEQEQQDPENSEEQEDSDEKKDDQPKDDQPEDEQPKDEQPKDEQPKDDQPEDDQPEDDQPEDEQPKDEQPKDDQEVEEPETPDEEQQQPAPEPMKLEDMTPQELARLLDSLEDLEKEQASLEKRLQGAGQIPVAKDW